MAIHECIAPIKAKQGHYGPALVSCWEAENGELWIENGEYEQQVDFCPICGYAAKKKIGEENAKRSDSEQKDSHQV